MIGTRPPRKGMWQVYLGVGLVAAALLIALLQPWSQDHADSDARRGTAGPGADPTTAPTVDLGPSDQASIGLEPTLVDWGGSAGQLAVVIRNDSPYTLRSARVTVTARDADGVLITRSSASNRTTCCTVAGLGSGEIFGVYAEIDRPVAEVAQVAVRYEDLSLSRTASGDPTVKVTGAKLTRTRDDAVVDATFTLTGSRRRLRAFTGYVIGQALLADKDGALVGVISGRFYCFSATARTNQVSMQFLRAVPKGTRVLAAFAYPVPTGAPVPAPRTCHSSGDTP